MLPVFGCILDFHETKSILFVQVVEATRVLSLEELPPVFILHMKRYLKPDQHGSNFVIDILVKRDLLICILYWEYRLSVQTGQWLTGEKKPFLNFFLLTPEQEPLIKAYTVFF